MQPLTGLVTVENRSYLATKDRRSGHVLEDLLLEDPLAPARRGGRRG